MHAIAQRSTQVLVCLFTVRRTYNFTQVQSNLALTNVALPVLSSIGGLLSVSFILTWLRSLCVSITFVVLNRSVDDSKFVFPRLYLCVARECGWQYG